MEIDHARERRDARSRMQTFDNRLAGHFGHNKRGFAPVWSVPNLNIPQQGPWHFSFRTLANLNR